MEPSVDVRYKTHCSSGTVYHILSIVYQVVELSEAHPLTNLTFRTMDSSSVFSITEHVIPSQHIREYPNAVRDELAPLQLAIKEYRPFNNLDAEPGSVTIIATHGLGFPKVFGNCFSYYNHSF